MIEAIKNRIAKCDSDSREDDGFTLIELIIVVVIIAVLAAIAIPLYNNFQENARESAVEASAANGLTYATSEVLNNDTSISDIQSDLNAQSDDITIEVDGTDGNEGSLCVTATHDDGDGATAQRGECNGTTPPGDGDED